MAYFKVGSLINCGNAATWRVTVVNRDGSIEAVWVSGRRDPPALEKRIERPEKYSLVEGRAGEGDRNGTSTG